MNSIKTGIAKIALNENVLDFQPLYLVGRAVTYGDEEPLGYKNIENEIIDDNLKRDLRLLVNQLLLLIKQSKVKYHLSFIELSLYDPGDRFGNRFFSLLVAK